MPELASAAVAAAATAAFSARSLPASAVAMAAAAGCSRKHAWVGRQFGKSPRLAWLSLRQEHSQMQADQQAGGGAVGGAGGRRTAGAGVEGQQYAGCQEAAVEELDHGAW